MPKARVTRLGARISSAPNPMLNQPRFRAIRSEAENELGPVLTTLGSPFQREMFISFPNIIVFSSGSGLQHDFDAAVLLVAENFVHLGPLLEAHGVGDDEGRIDMALLDELK